MNELEKGGNRRRRLEYVFEAGYKVASIGVRVKFKHILHNFYNQ